MAKSTYLEPTPFYAALDSSLYKTCLDKDGEEENNVVIYPRISHNKGYHNSKLIEIDTYDWQITHLNSNFKNAIDYDTHVEVVPLTATNIKRPAFHVKNIQHGEVVYINIICYIEDSSNSGTLDDYDFDHGSAVYSNQVAYRGDPINTKFKVWTTNNGKLIQDIIFDSPVEHTIEVANRADYNFFHKIDQTSNGSKETITDHLIRFEQLRDSGADFTSINNQEFSAKNQKGELQAKSKRAIAFVKDELAFYAHGRSLDLESVYTLLDQHPANFSKEGPRRKPDAKLFIAAVQNRQRQSPGYNSYVYPLLNPTVIEKNKGEVGSFFFPGRSGHGSGGSSGQICGSSTATYTWTPPGYPTCPSSDYACGGSDTYTYSYCYDKPCTSC